MEKFRNLGIHESIIQSIKEKNFVEPSEIQAKAIPLVLEGKDIIAGSATGSGKTFAFGSGIIQKIEQGRGLQALILTPTRELAEQVSKSIKSFCKYNPLEVTSIYGGVGIEPQIKELRKSEIVVGTPGRILDHLERRTIELKRLKILVLDEADRMLDMGFINDVERIIRACPKERQTLLFSATIFPEIVALSQKYMKNPIEISAESYVDPSLLKQVFYDIDKNLKLSLLVHLLNQEKAGLVMVFCNTRRTADFVDSNLNAVGIQSQAIHGGLSQNKRTNILKQFNNSKVSVLVCTDVAARGLDIKNVSHVYNYDLPFNSKDYIHRIGRTARAGSEGIAINLVSNKDYEAFNAILLDDSLKITEEKAPEDLPLIKTHFSDRRSRGFSRDSHGSSRFNRGRRFDNNRSRDNFTRRDRFRDDRNEIGYKSSNFDQNQDSSSESRHNEGYSRDNRFSQDKPRNRNSGFRGNSHGFNRSRNNRRDDRRQGRFSRNRDSRRF
ncbi:MAG: DEAD/DEAH box helicase [Candidatus Nanoarchaeia archaeon]